ncbi:hypothetical protein PF007_g13959 [Phytophthora fragariae]|uniref:C2H2-type domain-containing protein n=1 Tax=Phytophthora fragariae TaxID=53985 RepID=A0A6A3RXB5_9STRA|nr:hypothetical protein PF009_g16242 [Phytophthora fragariae]KAE9104714.1 hypothetical protein PF007_g13959 [Phytophthora fragariae]
MITTVRAKIEADDEFKTLDFVSIFKEVGSNTFDEFRKMAPVKQKVNKKLKDEATLLIKKFHMRACLVARSKIHIKTPQQTEVRLGAGDCVIFRGDVVHSGAAFTELNYKIHCVLVIKGIKWGADVTEFAPPPAYKCEFCPFMAPTKLQVSNHKRGCLRNPARAANRARDRELNKKGMFCCVCKKQFAKRNTYYKHYNRRHKPYLKL